MKAPLQDYIGQAVVTDGAWGTELQAHGLASGACPDAWNLDNPPAVAAVAAGYVQAGSEIILTNTFGSNVFSLASHGLGDRAGEIAEAGAAISRRTAGDAAAVFGSIGPTGKMLMTGETPPEAVHDAFAAQAGALARGGADAIVCETFADLDEVLLAVRAVRAATDLPVIACLTFGAGPDAMRTVMGQSPRDLASAAAQAGAAGVGSNCGAGPEHFVKVAAALRAATDLPVWIKPNAGLPALRDGQTIFPMGPEEFAGFAPALVQAGANFVGGCCGTTPAHIRAVRAAIK